MNVAKERGTKTAQTKAREPTIASLEPRLHTPYASLRASYTPKDEVFRVLQAERVEKERSEVSDSFLVSRSGPDTFRVLG